MKIPITCLHARQTLVNCIFAVLGIGCRVEVKIDGGVRQGRDDREAGDDG